MLKFYIITFMAVILYMYAFFPLPIATPKEQIKNFEQEYNNSAVKHRKIVLIIIDALRYDFVTKKLLPNSMKLMENRGCLSRLKAEIPTVTLPRIKALTTGNIAQFIDIVINLANPQILQDSIIHRAFDSRKKVVFYGDDTWLKLFPRELFVRSEGTNSFFVNDFYEVDNNVTRNLDRELNEKTDWDMMILHYLGLDHIGHVYGPKSNLIPFKLAEMDGIISRIYDTLENNDEDFIIFVTSDHGMRDSGGHGGSTFPEVNIPFLSLGIDCTRSEYSQIDVAANLAIISGFNIPATSIGQLQPQLLMNHLEMDRYLNALKYNTKLLMSKANICQDEANHAEYLHNLYKNGANRTYANLATEYYQNCSTRISEKLQNSSVKQNINSLIVASVVCLVVFLNIYKDLYQKHSNKSNFQLYFIFSIVLLQFFDLEFPFNICLVCASAFLLFESFMQLKNAYPNSIYLLIVIIQPSLFASSSFLEEEHQFWYFFTNTFFLFELIVRKNSNSKLNVFFLMMSLRFLRIINQVGDKYASSPDIADWLLMTDNYVWLIFVFLAGLVSNAICCKLLTKNSKKFSIIFDCLILNLIFLFRVVYNENATLGKLIWSLILLKFIVHFLFKINLIAVWILIISLLLKPFNVILVPFCVFFSLYLKQNLKNTEDVIIGHWWLASLLYFVQGQDNSLASIDISCGYVGLEDYQPIFVFLQVFSHTYALPALSHGLLLTDLNDSRKCFKLFLLMRINVIIIVFVVTFIQRHHLFIWSVFAPKIFVEAGHFAFLFIEMLVYHCYLYLNKLITF